MSGCSLILYHLNMANLWRLRLGACRLWLVPGILRLGACTCCPLIFIRGPNFSQALLMILSSAAMVVSWPGEAWLISIVNFFMFLFYLFFVSVSWRLQLEACGLFLLEIFCSSSHKREINPAYRGRSSLINRCV